MLSLSSLTGLSQNRIVIADAVSEFYRLLSVAYRRASIVGDMKNHDRLSRVLNHE
jgi:hypothetical protein